MAENFFSILKKECIYQLKPASLDEADSEITMFIHLDNHTWIEVNTEVGLFTLRLTFNIFCSGVLIVLPV